MISRENKGFSLVELVVVMTIIMVITAVGLVSFQSANVKSRDGRRQADLEKIRISLEMARQVGNTYPSTASIQSVLVPTYMQVWPSDPKTGWSYNYSRESDYRYYLEARLEGSGSDLGTSCGTVICNYRVTNP